MNAQRILVPLDGSMLAEAALPTAVEIAKTGGAIRLVRAVEAPAVSGGDPIEAQIRVVSEAESYLAQIEKRVRAEGVPVSSSVWYGSPAETILEATDGVEADLVVMSTHGRSGLNRLFLGSVAETVLRATKKPVLMLRTQGRSAMFKRVLVPLDGSMLAEDVLPLLTQIAGPLDLELTLLRVLVPIPPVVVEGSRYVTVEDTAASVDAAFRYLAPIAAALEATGVRVTTEVRSGEPVTEILDAAKKTHADLIAMTTHGRTGLGRLIFGSVAEAVLRQSNVPVFLVRGPKTAAAAEAAETGMARKAVGAR